MTSSAPYNPRFPQQNKTNYCWASFVQHKICITREEDEEAPRCLKYFKMYKELCPREWVEEWNEQIEEKRFPAQNLWQDLDD